MMVAHMLHCFKSMLADLLRNFSLSSSCTTEWLLITVAQTELNAQVLI